MAKYKLCPMCNTKNLPSVLECTECATDLMGIRILDDSIVDEIKETDEESATPVHRLVRICDCGAENEVSARKCTACGEDISDIIPTESTSITNTPKYHLTSIDHICHLELECPSEHVIGRENELANYLVDKSFVSRRHLKITVTQEGVFAENLSHANGTYLNNEKLTDGTAYKLCNGDELGLGGNGNVNTRQSQAAYLVVGIE